MQSPRSSGSPAALYPPSEHHRPDTSTSRSSSDLKSSRRLPAPHWAPLPTPPMSGSPPPTENLEPPKVSGRRRKRSATPPTAGSAGSASSQVPAGQATPRESGAQEQGGHRRATAEAPSQPGASSYGAPPGLSITTAALATLSAPAPAQEIHFGVGEISPRSARKTKAHVASACVNCKKKHLRCDNARPCRRCIQSSKESSCVDVEHKKRGRPPLKAEENSARRAFETALSPLRGAIAGYNRPPAAEMSAYPHQAHTRHLRPFPSEGGVELGRSVMPRPSVPFQSMYASSTVSGSSATAMGTMSRPYPGRLPSAPQPQSAYTLPSSGISGMLESEQMSNYSGSYAYQSGPQQSSGSGQTSHPYALFPRSTPQHQSPVHAPARTSYSHPSSMPPELRLPPIQPAPPGAHTDPAMAQQQRQAQQSRVEQQSSGGTTRQPDPKRPKISDILRHD